MTQATTPDASRDFGIFYPLHYVVVAVASERSARKIREDLQTGGYDEEDVFYFDPENIAKRTGEMIESAGLLAHLGTTVEAIRAHHDLAKKGAHFLMIHAPSASEVDRVMNVVRREKFRLAQKFHRFAIQDLS